MSTAKEPEAETVTGRINAVQRMLPPKKGVRSRTGYASLDYFAELLGTDRQTLIRWRKGAEPGPFYRQQLSDLSKGRFTPMEFSRPRPGRVELEARILELERVVALAAEDRARHVAGLRELGGQVERLAAVIRRLAEAQRPALRRQLLSELDEASQ